MQRTADRRDLVVPDGDVSLAGSLWLPPAEPVAILLMHTGSGPSDRHNDAFFPPIREHLLEAGIAVSSFDKRGVGGSTGRWEEASIVTQANDALACCDALRAEAADTPLGLFGHSQGGWVAVDAASRGEDVSFVVTSSGPGVTPGEQERYAIRAYMTRAGVPEADLGEVERYFDHLVSMMRAGVPFDDVRQRIEAEGFPPAFERLSLPFLPESEVEWNHMAALVDYDPRPALERMEVPVLAIFGGDDPIVPVEASVAAYRGAVRSDLLSVEVFPGGDHRLQRGDPPALVAGYLDVIVSFIAGGMSHRPASLTDL
jgi:uncharacterized protein